MMLATGLLSVGMPPNYCPIVVCTKDEWMPAFRITGLYIQPAAKPTMGQVEVLTAHRSRAWRPGRRMGHFVCASLVGVRGVARC